MITITWRLLFPINRKQFNPLNFFCTREFASAQDFTTLKSKQNVEKDPIPSKPKKPPNVFILYYNSVRNKLQEEYPHCKPKELSKIVSERWAQTDPTIKQNFQKQFREQTSIYKQKLMDYENSLTNEQKIKIIQELLKKGHTLKKNEIKQKLMELGKPKRSLSSFILFVQSKKDTKKPQESYKDWLNNITNEWKNMTMINKSKYNAEASDLYKKYKIEMQTWQDKMIQAGHYDIVKSNVKRKLETDKHEKQDSECPNQCSIPIVESIAANFSNVRIENNENIKIGWGTSTTHYTFKKDPDTNSDQRHESTKDMVFYDKNILQTTVECPRKTAVDTSINEVKKSVVQPQDTHMYTQIYTYFVSTWKRVLIVLKKTGENWKMKLY